MKPSILVVAAVEAEQAAIIRGLSEHSPIKVITCGVGPASAAAATAIELSKNDYQLVISAGIAGGFAAIAPLESLVVSSNIVAADLGAESEQGFLDVEQLGFGSCTIQASSKWCEAIFATLQAAQLPICKAPIITVCTATGTETTAIAHSKQVPGAAAEGMEGHGVATAATLCNVPVVELRAISNAVGPRDRAAWKIKEALHILEQAFLHIDALCKEKINN